MGIMDVLEELNEPPEEETTKNIPANPEPEELPPEDPALCPESSLPEPEEPQALPPEEPYPEEQEVIRSLKKRLRLRPEVIMGIIAGLAAVLLIVVLALSLPYMKPKDEDPDALPDRHAAAAETQELPQETFLEPTISETEPENPTIPPDRNPYDRYDFQYNRHNYLLLQNLPSSAGVDVSAYKGDNDWKKVKASGIKFAIIRLG